MTEIHYVTDAQGDYQIAPGDIELAQEHRLPEKFPALDLASVSAQCSEQQLQLVILPVNLHKDVMP